MAMNKGEWSELYAILHMLSEPDLTIVDDNLEEITNELYSVKNLSVKEQENIIKYVLENNMDVQVYFNDDIKQLISKEEISFNKKLIFDGIIHSINGNGAFEISGSNAILSKMTPDGLLKASSYSKADLQAIVLDNRLGEEKELKYSIKSSLGSPATILNASMQTNFIYEVNGISKNDIEKINSINTRTKLLDRIKMIRSLNGDINFVKVQNDNFEYNLKLIDSNMPNYLGDALLNSYEKATKNLKSLFLMSSKFDDETFALKKLGDFLEGISFGFFPSQKWDGINDVNGGLIVVKRNGSVVILDLVYYKNEVRKYLIDRTKFDSPSTTRYKMLELFEKDGKIYFTLNLQIRYSE